MMQSENPVAAVVACMFLGEGRYGLKDESGRTACPIFPFGGHAEWLQSEHGTAIDDVMDTHRDAVCAALDSVMIGGFAARAEVDAAVKRMTPEDAKAWLAERNDTLHTSLNNIGKRAAALARAIREKVVAR